MIDVTQPLKLRDGRCARVVTTNFRGDRLVTIVTHRDGNGEEIFTHDQDGKSIYNNPQHDLLPAV